jgi:hypothetical protein
MADIINKDVKVTSGKLIKVRNQKRAVLTNAKNWYYALWIEDHDGRNERCIMLTQREFEGPANRAVKNEEDCILVGSDSALRLEKVLWDEPGKSVRVYNKDRTHWKANKTYIAIIVEHSDGCQQCLLFTDYELQRAENRATRNPEDIPKKGWLADLLD